MNILPIGRNTYLTPSPLLPAFGSNITFDIGGSQREGSCKIYYATSKNDEKIYAAKTTVNDLGKSKFEDSADFIGKIVRKTKKVQENNIDNVKDMGYPNDENIINSMTLFIPSYTINDFAYYLPNHRNRENWPLKDLDFANIRELLSKRGVKIAPDMRFRIMQDAMGSGLAVAKKLYDNDMLSLGKYYTSCITGGGCGVANIEMSDENYITVRSTGSGYFSDGQDMQKVSRAGASAPAVIENFCRQFGINEEATSAIKSCHKAEFALENPVTYEKDIKTERLKQLLLGTEKYEVVKEDDEAFTIAVKPEYEKDYDRSRHSAIDKYCLAFARFAVIKNTEGSNGIIITGPLAKAINKVAKEHYNVGVSQWVSDKLLGLISADELKKVQKAYDFRIICDERFFLEDNTACKKLAHVAEFVAPNRGNWVKVNISDLKDGSSY